MRCAERGCKRAVYAKGLCCKHYTAMWRQRRGKAYTEQQRRYMKKYNASKLVGMTEEQRLARNRAHAAEQRVWRAKHADRLRESESYGQRYLRKYGMKKAGYDRLLYLQDGVCAICKRPQKGAKRLAVDHDHRTGVVRGLLCDACNHAIGEMEDSPARLRCAARYLSKFER